MILVYHKITNFEWGGTWVTPHQFESQMRYLYQNGYKTINSKELFNSQLSFAEGNFSTLNSQLYLMPIIESALGAINAYEVATASKNVVALTIGLEDYTADIGTQRTSEGTESFWARSQVVNAARAAGIQPIDSVFSDVADEEGLKNSVLEAKSLGFEGKGCIHPGQIKIIHTNFAPAEKEIEKAKRVVLALETAQKKGTGVVALGTKMIDPPVVKRAQNTIRLAILNGQVSKNWKTDVASDPRIGR